VQLRALWYAAIAETISWVGLITGMILKYGFDEEILVTIFGRVHGFLFLIYVVTALLCHTQYKWPIKRTLTVLAAAIPPFVGYYVVHGLIRDARIEQQTTSLAS
jgi:integral membrane protein